MEATSRCYMESTSRCRKDVTRKLQAGVKEGTNRCQGRYEQEDQTESVCIIVLVIVSGSDDCWKHM